MPLDTFARPTVAGLAGALTLALDLHGCFRRFHAVGILDGAGRALALRVVSHPPTGWDGVLPLPEAPDGCRAYLFSGRAEPVDPLAEADLERWRAMRARFAAAGVVLADWLICDGRQVRSLAITEGS